MSRPQPPHSVASEKSISNHDAVTDSEKPFGASAKADVILRSFDSVDFFVLKSILSLASPVFDDMFSLDQAVETNGQNSSDTMKNGLPIVQLGEDNTTMYNLLQFIYPYGAVKPSDMDMCAKVAEAARKYDMDGVLQRLQQIFLASEAVVKTPFSAFCIGTQFDWVEVMKEAALNTLSVPLSELVGCGESRMISGKEYDDLLRWRFACKDAVSQFLSGWSRFGSTLGPMADSLQQRLGETGCPRSTVLMQDSIVISAMQSVTESYYSQVMTNRTSMMKGIEKAVLKVPMKIGDVWVVPE